MVRGVGPCHMDMFQELCGVGIDAEAEDHLLNPLRPKGILGIDVDSTPGKPPFLLRQLDVDRHLVHDLTFS
ncbi:MAG: hypothetical protein BWY93_00810 [Euryarchaeota archaeon ADurb.BinA087]|nr:MAG: hypothetical protein BWY93_00810 [Euryarchaeota archaeon ADurb.BinA087]